MKATSACAVMLALVAPAFADRDEFHVEYFDVGGRTARELGADIDAKAPIGENGLRSDGYTRWSIRWTFHFDADGAGCTATRIDVDLDVHMTLPRWRAPRSADRNLVAAWNRYAAAVRLHEDGHRHRAEAAAADVRRALLRARHARDCHTLETRLNSLANQLLADLRRRQDAYDRETESGRRQGVVRP